MDSLWLRPMLITELAGWRRACVTWFGFLRSGGKACLQPLFNWSPRYFRLIRQFDQDGNLTGWSATLVQKLFVEAGLPYKPHVLPWPRALKMAQTLPDTLIFSLLQTDARLGGI